MNCELPDVQGGFRKGRETRDQIANICWIIKKARKFQKTSTSALLTTPKPLCGSQLWKILQYMGIADHLTCLLRNLYAGQEATVRTEHGTTDGSQLGEKYLKAVYCHLPYLADMQSTSCGMPDWMKHKLESRLSGEISITLDIQDETTLLAESEEEPKSLLIYVKEKVKKLA